MMRKLDQCGVAALEFCLVGGFLFTLMFAIFDFGRYAITMQSLRMLANASARANMINCYTPAVIGNTSPSSCTGDYLSAAQKQAVAPFAYGATVETTPGANVLTVKASLPGFTMLMPIWPTVFNAPSASNSIPF
jgi:TadE-like protein